MMSDYTYPVYWCSHCPCYPQILGAEADGADMDAYIVATMTSVLVTLNETFFDMPLQKT